MDVQAAILAAIADRPGDDTPRLAYADWLDDHAGDLPDPAAARVRAEFIRVQCEVKRLEHLPSALLQGYAELYRRQDHLLTHHRRDLLGPLADAVGLHDAVFDRGFVSEVGLEAPMFVCHAEAIAAMAPLPDVNVYAATPDRWFHGCPHVGVITSVGYATLEPGAADEATPESVPRPVWTRLRVLKLSGCDLTDATLRGIANSPSFPALTDLDLSFNAVTDAGVRDLVGSPLWPRLRLLVLSGNPLSDDAAGVLAEAPPTALKYLNIARTAITPGGQNRLLKRKGWKVDLF